MRKPIFARKLFLLFLLFFIISFSLFAQENDAEEDGGGGFLSRFDWFLKGTVLLFPEDNGMYSDPMPILPSWGAGISFSFTKIFKLELGYDYYMTYYGYNLGRAVPNAIENRTARVIGSLLALEAAAYFNFGSLLTLRVYAGPAADLRIIYMARDLNEDLDDLDAIGEDVDNIKKYFWGEGRWFMPVMGVGLDFTISPKIKLGIDLRVWAPLYKAWTNEDLPGIEGWRFGPGLRLTFL
ncbi:MAG: hypothetical protein FWH35_08740 [Treponema sp.]|nr:hypothetical protein [Treponema sp.]